jgi:uncharacterized protein YjbJ (UPF0337 family)
VLAGNERLKAKGQGDQFAGAARHKKGSLKERIKIWIDRLSMFPDIGSEAEESL